LVDALRVEAAVEQVIADVAEQIVVAETALDDVVFGVPTDLSPSPEPTTFSMPKYRSPSACPPWPVPMARLTVTSTLERSYDTVSMVCAPLCCSP
jgi:hypothetical protein